ncbi:hypothetical protein GPECTOR_1g75 [Gonium pectorale]|uniref:Cytochrome P450 n=1 Tax=Gonium pectorale TaxID=33097 RepID=A0A150H449_GONPE|nr:hypothetical protein GPECTOR_1g75 [Gonium pectorale]|eukprot:KXZ56831.1 hypothetical protein GPECTOR_1g75 [Gonium pectorale]
MVPRVLEVMHGHLASWEKDGKVPMFRAARLMGVDLGMDVIMQVQLPEDVDRQWAKSQVEVFLDGLYALPVSLPGTALRKAIAARDRLVRIFEPGVQQRHAEFQKQWASVGGSIQAYADMVLEQPSRQATTRPSSDGAAAAPPAAPGPKPSIMAAQLMGRAAIDQCVLKDAAMSVCHMLVAAADTTRFALFNTWSLLAMSPRVQDRLYEEQQKVIAQYGPELSYQATCHMPYMDATLKECMRLLPASAGGIRKLTRDLRVGQYVIPKGEHVWFHAGLLHCTDPALWDGRTDYQHGLPPHMDWRHNFDDAFRPERWLGGEEGRPRYHFTFGTGAHLCIGMNLVYLEIKLLLAMVLRKYRIRLECPDMLARCGRLFPFLVPEKGTDNVLLEAREGLAA